MKINGKKWILCGPVILTHRAIPVASQEVIGASTAFHPSGDPDTALLQIEKWGPEAEDAAHSYRIRVRNITQEDVGNGLEQVVEGIVLKEPLPPVLLFEPAEITAAGGIGHDTEMYIQCPASAHGPDQYRQPRLHRLKPKNSDSHRARRSSRRLDTGT